MFQVSNEKWLEEAQEREVERSMQAGVGEGGGTVEKEEHLGVAVGVGCRGTGSSHQEAVQYQAENTQCRFCFFREALSLFLIPQGLQGVVGWGRHSPARMGSGFPETQQGGSGMWGKAGKERGLG